MTADQIVGVVALAVMSLAIGFGAGLHVGAIATLRKVETDLSERIAVLKETQRRERQE